MTMLRRGLTLPGVTPVPAAPGTMPVGPVVQVRLYTAHSILTGSLRLSFNRLTDHLNFGPATLALGQAELVRHDHPTVHRAREMAHVQRDAIMLALDRLSTDYVASHPALHQDREPLEITADLGHFVVTGTLHARRGLDLDAWLVDAPLFVPLTAVTIYGDGGDPITEPIAIINRASLSAVLH